MITLKNVRKENDMILADYFPEDSKVSNEIKINVKTLEFTGELVGYYLESKGHLGHARMTLRKMAEGKEPIQDTTIMWY